MNEACVDEQQELIEYDNGRAMMSWHGVREWGGKRYDERVKIVHFDFKIRKMILNLKINFTLIKFICEITKIDKKW